MSSFIMEELEAVMDKLHQEGHTLAVRVGNILHAVKEHFHHAEAAVETEVAQVEVEVAPVVEAVKSEAKQAVKDTKAEVEAGLAEAADVLKK